MKDTFQLIFKNCEYFNCLDSFDEKTVNSFRNQMFAIMQDNEVVDDLCDYLVHGFADTGFNYFLLNNGAKRKKALKDIIITEIGVETNWFQIPSNYIQFRPVQHDYLKFTSHTNGINVYILYDSCLYGYDW